MTPDDRRRIEDALATYVAPLVAKDGATVRLVGVEGDTVTVALEGTYLGCPGRPTVRDRFIAPLLSKELGRAITVALD